MFEKYGHDFGFLHPAIRDYLAAQHAIFMGERAMVKDLIPHADEDRWRPLFKLIAESPASGLCRGLVEGVLKRMDDIDGASAAARETFKRLRRLVEALFRHAAEPDLEPYLGFLDPKRSQPVQELLLKLLATTSDPRVPERAKPFIKSDNERIRSLAIRCSNKTQRFRRGQSKRNKTLFLPMEAARADGMELVVAQLEANGLHVLTDDMTSRTPRFHQDPDKLADILKQAQGLLLAAISKTSSSPRGLKETRDLFGLHAHWIIEISFDGEYPYDKARARAKNVLRLSANDPDLAHHVSEALEYGELPSEPAARPSQTPFELQRSGAIETPYYSLHPDASDAVILNRLSPAVAVSEVSRPRHAAPEGQSPIELPNGIRLLPVREGNFFMGWRPDQGEAADEGHRVEISRFLLAETPVTREQFRRFAKDVDKEEPVFGRLQRFSRLDQPVVGVNWTDARDFCRWMTDQSKKYRFFLPTEAQWEYAARSTDGRLYPWGDPEPTPETACYGRDWYTGGPDPVGSYPDVRGPFGHLDLAGTVWEWCLDTWDAKPHRLWRRSNGTARNPVVRTGRRPWSKNARVVKGGSWRSVAAYLEATHR